MEKIKTIIVSRIVALFLIGLTCAGFFFPSGLNWGFHFFGFLPASIFIGFLTILILLFLAIEKGSIDRFIDILARIMEKRPGIFLASACALFIIAATVLRVKIPLLGDSFILLNNYEYTFNGAHLLYLFRSPLAFSYFYFFANLLQQPAYPGILDAFLLGELILGIGVIVCTYFTIKNLMDNSRYRLLAFGFLLVLPYMQVFFGYAELYSVGLFFLSLFILVSILYLKKKVPFYLVPPVYLLLYASNYLNVILLPGLLFLAFLEFRTGKKITLLAGLLLCGLIIVGAFAAVNFDTPRFFQSKESGHWLPLSYQPGDQFAAYGMFSFYHVVDLFNLFVFLAPGALFFIAYMLLKERTIFLLDEVTGFFISSAVLFFGFIAVVKLDLGVHSDWDIAAPYFYMLNLFVLLVFLRTTSPEKSKIVSLLGSVSLLITLSWLILNSSTAPALQRAEKLQDRRVTSAGGLYQSFFHISMYYHHTKQHDNQTDVWKRYTALFPNDWHGLQNLAQSYSEGYVVNDTLAEKAYERWITVDSLRAHGTTTYANFLSGRGLFHYRKRFYPEAERQLRKAIVVNPYLTPAYNNLASLYLDRQLPDSTISLCQRAIEINPGYTVAYQNLANAYAQKAELDTAIFYYKHVLSFDPTYLPAYENISRAYYQNGDRENAIESLQRAARLGSKQAQSVLTMSGVSW